MFKKFFASPTDENKTADNPTNSENESNQVPDELSPHIETSPWNLSAAQATFLLLFALTVGVSFFLRLFKLDAIQNEIYGDIDIVIKYVTGILAGTWPTKFVLSAGPLYNYLIAPIIFLTGVNYFGLKLASAIVSLGVLAATYAFSRRLLNDYFALLVMFIAGVSSWLLIFSRLGNLLIMLPVLTMIALWLVVRTIQYKSKRDLIACALVSGLGLFVYPQSFILPGVIFVTLLCLQWTGEKLPRRWILIYILASIPCAVIFGILVASDPSNFTSGYIGNKIIPEAGNNVFMMLGRNVINATLALHVRGDDVFRSNPLALPHLDWISGILFLGGVVFWFVKKERRRWIPVWLVPFILLQVPSILILNQAAEVPSASRTLGIAPIVYMLVASGIWWLVQTVYPHTKRWIIITGVSLLLGSILYLNAERYFQTYIDALPYNDTPIGQTVATYANSLPDNTQVYMVDCCWEYGMPENYVEYEMTHPGNLHYANHGELSCAHLQSVTLPAVFIWSFHKEFAAPALEGCKPWLPAQLYTYHGRPVFFAAPLNPDLSLLPNSTLPPEGEYLEHEEVQLDGQTTQVDYSSIDSGSLGDLFDNNWDSLMRGARANPIVVVLHFSQPRKLNNVDLDLGSMQHFQVTVTLTYTDNSSKSVNNDYQDLPDDPHVTISLPEESQLVTTLRLTVQDMNPLGDTEYHIHLRGLQVR